MMATAFLRLPDVIKATGVPRSTLYRLISNGDFPQPIKLGERSVAWSSAEIEAWMARRIAARPE